ncbi:IS110-like element ISCps1 family transposase [Colwellia psychrerythraea]|uniref:ISCps1, transposase n=1 Tax=Colwellia psychrerythraea (strain 34H / ATCC BAA-681) TaxID=167879 RepID=Q489X9_COLP3|nr:IS110-like element ISCps1 family transposase [Colwellia psychrerythraea]AAZ27051.1 ISCps1, transposase [Colwellia psychrerythraea 34H]
MNKVNTIGVDLAKNVIQVSVLSPLNKELTNKELPRTKFAEFLAKQPISLVAFEACSTAHHWARLARSYGHRVKILPAKVVSSFRQGHKTDKNDALAVAEAANRPNVKEAPLKELEQQGMQSIQRSRELLVQNKTCLSNHIRGLLMEFGVFIPKGFASLFKNIPDILEDGENDIPDMFRATLNLMYQRLLDLRDDVGLLDEQVKQLVKNNEACSNLTKMEGVGPISAILLFSTLGTGDAFKNGREFSAYIGLTPKQHSSGGKASLMGISKFVANKRLRSVLIQGARSYVHRMKSVTTKKDEWLVKLIERAGYGKAAVALANKNVRTAWALLTQGTEYRKELIA